MRGLTQAFEPFEGNGIALPIEMKRSGSAARPLARPLCGAMIHAS